MVKCLRSRMRNGGVRFPNLANGLYLFSAPKHFAARGVVMRKDAMDSSAEEA